MKKMFALLLALSLLLTAVPAFAAPTRDTKAAEITVDDNLTYLTELIVNAAILQEMPAALDTAPVFPELAKEETPSDLLVSCALAWGINAGYLAYDSETVELSTLPLATAQAQELYRQVFTNPDYAFAALTDEEAKAAKAENENRTWYIAGELNVAFAPLCDYGVHIYSAKYDGTDVEILCDVFTAQETEVELSADEIPEDKLVWQCNARVSLRTAPETPFGYTVSGVSVSPFYQAGDLTQWKEFENEEMEYSVNLPSFLGVANDTAANRVWQSADGKATLTISVMDEKTTLDDAAAIYQAANPKAEITREQEFDRFSVVQPGSYILVTTSEDAERLFMISFTFPDENQAEYEFYAEIIRNSLSVWGLSNG